MAVTPREPARPADARARRPRDTLGLSPRQGVLLVEGRVLRRVIQTHRHLRGLGLGVPHVHCYALPREELLRAASHDDVDALTREELAGVESVILIAKPSHAEIARLPAAELTSRLWRAAFHARVHVALDERIARGELTDAALRERIDHIGQTEFDEIREILRQDDLLLPPGGDREAYTEFVALFLELSYFAPRLLATTFPSLDAARITPEIARDVDAKALLESACPEGVDPAATIALASARATSTAASTIAAARFVAPEASRAERLLRRAEAARAKQNHVRSAILCAAVAHSRDAERARAARASVREDVEALARRLDRALEPPPGSPATSPRSSTPGASLPPQASLDWAPLLSILADEAALRSGGVRSPIEARLLLDLQSAALAHEETSHAVDLVTWALSRGKRDVVRPLPMTRTLRIARYLSAAARKVKLLRITPADRKLVTKLLDRATLRATNNVRAELRPKIVAVFNQVGLEPRSTPELIGRDKMVEELLDQAVAHGFINLGHVRDAISRNHLKLDDLASGTELWSGDALLDADRELSVALDGVYRAGEIYLRGLQKVSSVLFGTPLGRGVVLYAMLPLGGAYIALEGAGHVLAPLLRPLGVPHFTLFFDLSRSKGGAPPAGALGGLETQSFWLTVAIVFGLLHSETFRSIFMVVLRFLGRVLVALLVAAPRWLVTRPTIARLLGSRPARIFARHVLVPGLVSAAVVGVARLVAPGAGLGVLVGLTAGVFLLSTLGMGSRLADRAEDVIIERVAPTWKAVSARVLPGLFRAVMGLFRWVLDGLERLIYRVDETLRFRSDAGKVAIFARAFVGAIWFVISYLMRVYVALLIEPYVNPVKQVPMTAAAHKLLLPFAPQIIVLFDTAFRPLGPLVGGPLAALTAFFFPTIFGFFGWELKENYKLYRASRRRALPVAVVGAHGETMAGFLVPGFHSGTLPKLFARLRHAARREEERDRDLPDEAERQGKSEGARGRFREGQREVEEAVRHFVEREMFRILVGDPRWPHGELEVKQLAVSANRIGVAIVCKALPGGAAVLRFDEQSGSLVAGLAELGFVASLGPSARVLFENAVAGLYQLAGVDYVREQLEAVVGADVPYDLTDAGLVVWPGPGYTVELVYPLRARGGPVAPKVLGGTPAHPPPSIDVRALSFHRQPIAWDAWVAAWRPDQGAEVTRLMTGPSLLRVPVVAEPPPAAATGAAPLQAATPQAAPGHAQAASRREPARGPGGTLVDDTLVDRGGPRHASHHASHDASHHASHDTAGDLPDGVPRPTRQGTNRVD